MHQEKMAEMQVSVQRQRLAALTLVQPERTSTAAGTSPIR
jgi:hypothetical protein